jgi:AMP phosphorylase
MALNKMRDIIKVQGGNPDITVEKIEVGQFRYEVKSPHKGVITGFNNKDLTVISRILGCPEDKKAGIHLDKRIDQKVDKDDTLCTLFATSRWKLEEAKATLSHVPIYKVQ